MLTVPKQCFCWRSVRVACFYVSFGDVGTSYKCSLQCILDLIKVAEQPPFGKVLFRRYAVCFHCIMSLCLFVTLVLLLRKMTLF